MLGPSAGHKVTTGVANTCVGYVSGNTLTTGSNNVFIGRAAGASVTSDSSQLYIARDNTGVGNAATWIYGNSVGSCYQGSNASTWSQVSDERIKKDIADSPNGLAKIDAIQVRNFNFRTEEEITVEGLTACDAAGLQTGIIAQELELVLPNAVTENERGMKQVQTDPIFWAMVKAIQELSAKNDALETQNATFAARLTALEGE